MRRNFFSEEFVRIIAGSARGLKLVSPDSLKTRPTLDRVKEAVFSMLMPYLYDSKVLDLFAGSGALGLEALSRGAKESCFVDVSNEALNCIKQNVSVGRFTACSSIVKCDAEIFLENCKEKYDIIFLDPPYAENLYSVVLSLIDRNEILSKDGLIVAEWDFESGFTSNFGNFDIVKEKKYGRVCISVLRWRKS